MGAALPQSKRLWERRSHPLPQHSTTALPPLHIIPYTLCTHIPLYIIPYVPLPPLTYHTLYHVYPYPPPLTYHTLYLVYPYSPLTYHTLYHVYPYPPLHIIPYTMCTHTPPYISYLIPCVPIPPYI